MTIEIKVFNSNDGTLRDVMHKDMHEYSEWLMRAFTRGFKIVDSYGYFTVEHPEYGKEKCYFIIEK